MNISLSQATLKVIEAATTLGVYESVEAFITKAAPEKAADFQQKVRVMLGQTNGIASGRRLPN